MADGSVIDGGTNGGIIGRARTILIDIVAANFSASHSEGDRARVIAGIDRPDDVHTRRGRRWHDKRRTIAKGTHHLGLGPAGDDSWTGFLPAHIDTDILRTKAVAGEAHGIAGPGAGGINGKDARGIGGLGGHLSAPLPQRLVELAEASTHSAEPGRGLPLIRATELVQRPALNGHQHDQTLYDHTACPGV